MPHPSPSASVLSDEVFIFPPNVDRQFSNNSDPPSPRNGILKVGSSSKVNGFTNGKYLPDTSDDHSPEINYARKRVRHSIVSIDSTFDLPVHNHQLPKRVRFQRKLSVYLHTHVVLIIVSTLAILDAVCVIGQLIADIIIMQEKLKYFEDIDEDLTEELLKRLPELNTTGHEKWNLHAILEVLMGRDIHTNEDFYTAPIDAIPLLSENHNHRSKRALPVKVPGHEVDHGVLYKLTHACHYGSMVILSLLLLETMLKVFAMGRKLKHHKLEIFDALVVTISWCLDVGLWEGIWAHPGTQAATYLMYLLPWRVIRIVNSFVLVIQEKEHVLLKIVKQRLRQALRRSKEALEKAASYRHEAKAMAGMCRKLGATEQEITACSPTGKAGRRGSVQSVLERAASLTFISTLSHMGSLPSLFDVGGSSSDDDDGDEERNQHRNLDRKSSEDPTLRSQDSFSTEVKLDQDSYSADVKLEQNNGHENKAFRRDSYSGQSTLQVPTEDHRDTGDRRESADIAAKKEDAPAKDTTSINGTRL